MSLPSLSRSVIVIVGPTASGKSELAQEVALAYDGAVLSADSMQVYRGMDIGTGKVLPVQRKVEHFGLDLVEPGEPYSAAMFQDYAREVFARIDAAGRRCVLAGGTGFYVRAAVDDYSFPKGDQVGNPVRDEYTAYAQIHGSQALWELLRERDPESAEVIHPNNTRRVIRAFELLSEGESYARQKENLQTLGEAVRCIRIGLHVDPDVLRARIDRRVDAMVEAGLVDEVKDLLNKGFREGITAPQAIGYKEIVAALDGTCTLSDAIDSIKMATRRYAKRQRTWFRKDQRIHWIDATDYDVVRLLEQVSALVDQDDGLDMRSVSQ